MNIFTAALFFFASTIGFPFLVQGQSQSKPEPQKPDTIVVERSEVILDAIVRDRKGRPVTNLTAADFAVYENGVRQQISSFRLVSRREENSAIKPGQPPANQKTETKAAPSTPGLRNTPAVMDNKPNAVALVFDRLSPDARARAHSAALAYIAQGLTPDDYVGVFIIDQKLKVLQAFTNDAQLIREAINQAEKEGSSVYADSTSEITELSKAYEGAIIVNDQLQASAAGTLTGMGRSDEARNVLNQSASGFAIAAIGYALRTLEGYERLERNQQGYATTDSLIAIIHGLSTLPRRKALLFFSEGVAVTSATTGNFRAVISNANRSGVSVYSIDAAGLRTQSSDVVLGQAMTALGQRRISQAGHGGDNGLGAMTKDLERNEDLIGRNPANSLGQLADQTGGLFISSTNDPGARLRQVNEDLHSYYLLSYSPINNDYDGNFRQTNVNITRPGFEVQARKGYYALAESYDYPVLAYEATGLAILGGKSQPNAFETRAGAFSFPEPARPGLVPVVVEVPAGAINFLVDNAKTKYSADFSIVALVRDEAGHVARKLSTHYLLSGPYDKLDAALNGSILFYKETQLEPGRYSVSSIVYDALAKQSSTSAADVIIPATEKNALQLSSIVLVKNGERLSSANKQASKLFRFNDALLYPNLGVPLSRSETGELTIFITAYGPPGEASAPKLALEITQSGRTLGQLHNNLPAPDETGRIQYASAISLDKLQPGDYELKVSVQNAKSMAVNSARFTVIP
jgi:VWFA-related protein